MEFIPIYKYFVHKRNDEDFQIDNKDISGDSTAACLNSKSGKKYCTNTNLRLNIENPRLVLLENIRQSCIHLVGKKDDYWNYMEAFADTCANKDKPDFTKACADKVITKVEIDKQAIENCMKEEVACKF